MPVGGLLPAFPVARRQIPVCAPLGAHGIGLRPATDADLSFFRQLYGELRADELRQALWPEDMQQAFLDSQFAMQHRHFVTYYAATDFWVVEHCGEAAGRYYLLRGQENFHIIDIALSPSLRGRGIGSALIEWTQSLAAEIGTTGIDLHVDQRNLGAQRLYQRLGFKHTTIEGPYLAMRWQREPALS